MLLVTRHNTTYWGFTPSWGFWWVCSRIRGWCQQQPFASNPCHGVLLYQWRLELAHCLWVLHFTEFYPWPIYWPIVPALANSCCTCKTTDVKEMRRRHLGTMSLERQFWDRKQEKWAWTLLHGKAWGSRHFCFQNVIPWVFFVTGLMVGQRKTSAIVWLSIIMEKWPCLAFIPIQAVCSFFGVEKCRSCSLFLSVNLMIRFFMGEMGVKHWISSLKLLLSLWNFYV